MQFVDEISFNSSDWKIEKRNGRTVITADHRGVKTRAALVVRCLGKSSGYRTARDIIGHVQDIDPNYSNSDIRYALHLLVEHGIASQKQVTGKQPQYTLTAAGKRAWKEAEKVFV